MGSARPFRAVPTSCGSLPQPVPCVFPTVCWDQRGLCCALSSALFPAFPSSIASSPRASHSPGYFRDGHMPWISLPPTQETRSGILACGGGGGSDTGDTSPGTPGPRSASLRVSRGRDGPRQKSHCWEGHADPHFCPPSLCTGDNTPHAGTFDLSPGNTRALPVPASGRWTHGEPGQTCLGQHGTCPAPVLWAALSQTEPQSVHFCLPHPYRSHSGSCIVSMTQTNLPSILGSYVALNERKAWSPHQTSRGSVL